MNNEEYNDLPTLGEWLQTTTQGAPLFEWTFDVSIQNTSSFDLTGEWLGITNEGGLSIEVPLGPTYFETEFLPSGGTNIFLGVGREIELGALGLDDLKLGFSAEAGWGSGINGTRLAVGVALGPYSLEPGVDVDVDLDFDFGEGSVRIYRAIEEGFIESFMFRTGGY
jgi:hypothetical protein